VAGAAGTVQCELLPLADGGDGSVDAAVAAGFTRRSYTVAGPTGQPVQASIAFDGETAVVEVTNTCGLALLPEGKLEALNASSRGFGEAVLFALSLAPARIVLALGGSASTDGGMASFRPPLPGGPEPGLSSPSPAAPRFPRSAGPTWP